MQAPLDIVHVNVYVPAPPAGVKTAAGAEVLLNWVVNALGPLTVHTPVPTVGVLAAKVAVLPKQTDWLEPAEEIEEFQSRELAPTFGLIRETRRLPTLE